MPRRKLNNLHIVHVPRIEEVTNDDDDLSSVGSSHVPEMVEKIEIEGENGRRCKTRGYTTLTELYDLPVGERVKVSRNNVGQPIGAETGDLASYLGIVARNASILPINHESWCHIPKGNKRQALDLIKDREHIEVANRRKQKFTHTAGTKSFARIANEKMKMRGKRTEYEATSSIDGFANIGDIENQVFLDVLGPERYGRVRGQGSFVTPTKYFGSNMSKYMSSQSQSSQAKVNRLKQKLTQFQAEIEAREAEREMREAEREAERAARETEREAAYQNLQKQFQDIMAILKQNQQKNLPP